MSLINRNKVIEFTNIELWKLYQFNDTELFLEIVARGNETSYVLDFSVTLLK